MRVLKSGGKLAIINFGLEKKKEVDPAEKFKTRVFYESKYMNSIIQK